MFTGIIEALGIVKSVISNGSNLSFWIESPISDTLKADQSLSHDGVCLTVEEVQGNTHRVTAIQETLEKSNLAQWNQGYTVNLERCLQLSSRIDGHLVQGHVDCKARCIEVVEKSGSRELTFSFPKKFGELLIEKGSVTINGISLTVFNVKKKQFTVSIVPFTATHTTIYHIKEGDEVNIEFDIIGKYLARRVSLKVK